MPILTDQQLHDLVDQGRQGVPAWWTGPELEYLLHAMIDSKGNRQDPTYLADFIIKVGGPDQFDPPAGVSVINLPEAYEGKRIRVLMGGPDLYTFFGAWSRTTQGFQLTLPGATTEAGTYYCIQHY